MFIARFKESTKEIQTVQEHNKNVSILAERNCDLPCLKSSCVLLGLLHDSGKYGREFQEYIQKRMDDPEYSPGTKVDHAFAGGWIVTDLANSENKTSDLFYAEMIRHAILCHHGLRDCVRPDRSGAEISYDKRAQNKDLPMREINKEVQNIISRKTLKDLFLKGKDDFKTFQKKVKNLLSGEQKKSLGSEFFYYGMCERLLLSYLIDADRTDAACYTYHRNLPVPQSEKELDKFWEKACGNLDHYLNKFPKKNEVDLHRAAISQECCQASQLSVNLYRLIVPTGGGKTLASIRFAWNHAKHFRKRHFFYIAPFNSILEQNADVIRRILPDEFAKDSFLEHHCSVIPENENDEEKYRLFTENWDIPLVATSAVQFLDTFFSGKSDCVRRMRALVNAVIVVDEVQAIPVKCQSLFNLAVNFLTEFCNTVVVLCSATQPPSDKLPQNRMTEPEFMVKNPERYFSVFKRTRIIDALRARGYSIPDLAQFTLDRLNELESSKTSLVIVNTKAAAKKLYLELKERNSVQEDERKFRLFHLSTNMTPYHRKEILRQVRECLNNKIRVICVSTQLIEAGVDISFHMVIRSLSGLDSIAQAAGRCNRNAEFPFGNVYIVNLESGEENVSRLREIIRAQNDVRGVLRSFHNSPDHYENDLLSLSAMMDYYARYYSNRNNEPDYKIEEFDTTAVELLSTNTADVCNYLNKWAKKIYFRQAFATAGNAFGVIEENAKYNIVVECPQSKEDIKKLRTLTNITSKKNILRNFQNFTVGISEILFQKLNKNVAWYLLDDYNIIVLKEEYYSLETGVSDVPAITDNGSY